MHAFSQSENNMFSLQNMNGNGFLLQCAVNSHCDSHTACMRPSHARSHTHTHACFLHAIRIDWIPLSITYLSVSPSLHSSSSHHHPFLIKGMKRYITEHRKCKNTSVYTDTLLSHDIKTMRRQYTLSKDSRLYRTAYVLLCT